MLLPLLLLLPSERRDQVWGDPEARVPARGGRHGGQGSRRVGGSRGGLVLGRPFDLVERPALGDGERARGGVEGRCRRGKGGAPAAGVDEKPCRGGGVEEGGGLTEREGERREKKVRD